MCLPKPVKQAQQLYAASKMTSQHSRRPFRLPACRAAVRTTTRPDALRTTWQASSLRGGLERRWERGPGGLAERVCAGGLPGGPPSLWDLQGVSVIDLGTGTGGRPLILPHRSSLCSKHLPPLCVRGCSHAAGQGPQ